MRKKFDKPLIEERIGYFFGSLFNRIGFFLIRIGVLRYDMEGMITNLHLWGLLPENRKRNLKKLDRICGERHTND
jgi:hypothetical protein